MPTDSTPARHCRQSSPGACLPACVQMVLATWGDERSEAQWATILGSYDFGTPSSHVKRLARLGYQVQYRRFLLDELRDHLENGLFPLVFVRADLLPWATWGGFHALVLTRITPTDLALLDPALNEGPTQIARDSFVLAWEEFGCLAAAISR
jgi:ABC-type bacteriocin/lantibiotic exporter with double-glycine peptidase domain